MGIAANTYSKETYEQRICFEETEDNHLMHDSLLQKLLQNTFFLLTYPRMLRILRYTVPKTYLHKQEDSQRILFYQYTLHELLNELIAQSDNPEKQNRRRVTDGAHELRMRYDVYY